MSDKLPRKAADWRQAAKRNNIGHTQALSAGTAFVSGSKFKFEHFLRLRVLYIGGRPAWTLAESPGFPKEHLEEMDKILKENIDASFLKNLLQDTGNIRNDWNVEIAKKSGMFAVALEHLHLIAKRGVDEMTDSDDTNDLKIVWSPPKTRSMTQSGPQYHGPSLPMASLWTPTPKSRQSKIEPPSPDTSDIFEMSNLTMNSPEEDIFERSDFSPGDEQTVNAALVALIMALSWLLGYTGRVHHDRARFSISKDDETDIYAACVDGLIMHLNEGKFNGFMEVKRDFRGRNASVRRQIAAQMAAFIFEQDFVLARKETEGETEKASKGKGKKVKARAKEDKTKGTNGGNQEKFRKWMVSLDGYYAHINIATYDRKYVEFLSGSQPSAADDAFMEMVEYGYFDLRVWSGNGLEIFLKYVGALMLGTSGP